MSGYFVHGGTQYPGINQNQSADQSQQQTQHGYQNTYNMGMYDTSNVDKQQHQSTFGQFQTAVTDQNQYSTSSNRTHSQSMFGSIGSSQYHTQSQSYGVVKNEPSQSQYKTDNSFYSNDNSNFTTGSSNSNAYGQQYQKKSAYSTSFNKPIQHASNFNSYEKALHAAANQYYSNQNNRGRGRGGGRGSRGRGRGGGIGSTQNQASAPKPIKATEIKAYLYAWCGQRRLKPEYEIEPVGAIPKIEFSCTLKVTGLDYVAKVTASSKKDAQTKAAWDYAENLIKQGYMKKSELPDKPPEPLKSQPPQPKTPVGVKVEDSNTPENTGGWTVENCRQRLNQFCQRERIPAEFKHETSGPEHSRTFTAEMCIKISWLDNKEFQAKEKGKNKKQATVLCALSIVRQLCKEEVIEKFGDPIKIHGKVLPAAKEESMDLTEDAKKTGVKRKADVEVEVDEKGNWTLENSRQRLNLYCKAKNKPCKIDVEEKVISAHKKVYVATMALDVTVDGEDKKLDSSQTANSKKVATQQCALDLIKQLYDLKLVEPNLPSEKKRNQRRSGENMYQPMSGGFDQNYGQMGMVSGFGGPMGFGMPFFPRRTTGITEMIVNEKHNRIYPEEQDLLFIQNIVVTIERGLKKVADAIADEEEHKSDADGDDSANKKKGVLHGVMRVGRLAKGLLLKHEKDVQLVLLCNEKPTEPLLTKILALLGKFLQEDKSVSESSNLTIKPVMAQSLIQVDATSKENEAQSISVKISITSALLRNAPADSKDPPHMLNKESCLHALGELRHAKWFQACASGLPSCLVVLRILLDVKRRVPTWSLFPDWALELLVEKALVTSYGPLSEGDALRRVFSCLASGILLPGGPGLQDPCEKEKTDVLDSMTIHEKQDITESAQHAMRLIVYRQAYKVLGIEPPPPKKDANSAETVKTEADSNNVKTEES